MALSKNTPLPALSLCHLAGIFGEPNVSFLCLSFFLSSFLSLSFSFSLSLSSSPSSLSEITYTFSIKEGFGGRQEGSEVVCLLFLWELVLMSFWFPDSP